MMSLNYTHVDCALCRHSIELLDGEGTNDNRDCTQNDDRL
jgi:hypothetical protein